jgi:hypothetical protein
MKHIVAIALAVVVMGGPRFVAAAESLSARTMPGPPVYSATARGADGSIAVMFANPGNEEVPFELEIAGGGNLPAARCRITDETRTWEEVPLPAALQPHSFIVAEFQ